MKKQEMYRTPLKICTLAVIVSIMCQSPAANGSVTGPPLVEAVPVPDSHTETTGHNQGATTSLQSDQDKMENLMEDAESKPEQSCQHLEVKGANQLQRIREIKSKDYSFFLRPKEDFTRLTIRLRMQNILDVSEVFDTQETVEIHKFDLREQPSEWVKIRIQYYRHSSRGPNYHALRITIGNETRTIVTGHWWFTYTYEGFLLSSEGGLDLLFNCSPEDYFLEPKSSSPQFWLLAGGLVSLTLVSVALGCIVVMCKRRQPQKDGLSSPPNSVTYDEFDEEMLARIQQKVEALREGRASESSNSGGKRNDYILHLAPVGENQSSRKVQMIEDDDNVFENHYEDINELQVDYARVEGKGECENHYENVQLSADSREISGQNDLNIANKRNSYENIYDEPQSNLSQRTRDDCYQSVTAHDNQSQQENIYQNMQDDDLENHYKLPTSVKKARSNQRMSWHEKHDENTYEILYPLDYDTPRAKYGVPKLKL